VNARQFHDATAHTPYSVRTSDHTLDWDVKPFPFKVYTETPAIELPRAFDPVDADTLAAVGSTADGHAPLDLARLVALLYLSAGVTKKKVYGPGAEVLFRAAASTGALYQTEVYVAAGEVSGLAPGLYHFCPGDFTLRRLREVDTRRALAQSAADEALSGRAAVLVLSAIYWRNTWKYQARGFRHLFWDSGTMLANVLAVGHALGASPTIVTGFVDDEVNHVLGVDAERETALELVGVGPARSHRSITRRCRSHLRRWTTRRCVRWSKLRSWRRLSKCAPGVGLRTPGRAWGGPGGLTPTLAVGRRRSRLPTSQEARGPPGRPAPVPTSCSCRRRAPRPGEA